MLEARKCRRTVLWIGSGLSVLIQGLTRLALETGLNSIALESRKYVRIKNVSQNCAVDLIRPQDVEVGLNS